jgi:hypothetical protein
VIDRLEAELIKPDEEQKISVRDSGVGFIVTF